jgi:hypothetical protein
MTRSYRPAGARARCGRLKGPGNGCGALSRKRTTPQPPTPLPEETINKSRLGESYHRNAVARAPAFRTHVVATDPEAEQLRADAASADERARALGNPAIAVNSRARIAAARRRNERELAARYDGAVPRAER